MKILYILYQYLIGFPLVVVATIFTALFTIICFPWKNGKAPRTVQVLWSRSVLWFLLVPIKVTGREHVNPKQSYVFVANHQSFLDVFAVYGWLPNNFKWLMKKEIRKVPFVGTACKVAGHIFVDRSNPRAALQSMEHIKGELVDGISTVIFPEGTRNQSDDELLPFNQGAAIMAIKTKTPIVPIVIYKKPKMFRRAHILIGEPFELTEYYDKKPTGEQLAEIDNYLRDRLTGMRVAHSEFLANKKKKKA